MARPHDFKSDVISALSERVAHTCSFPGCTTSTIGPSEESAKAVNRTGMACHIYAASTGPAARRVAADQSIDLTNISNGIWMCYKHGKLIDGDESRYKPETLQSWRAIAELKAKLAHETGISLSALHKVDTRIKLSPDGLAVTDPASVKSTVFDFFEAINARAIWGQAVSAEMRTFTTEFIANVYKHGDGTFCRLSSDNNSISIVSDGVAYSPDSLLAANKKRGGARALADLRSLHPNCLMSYDSADINTLKMTVASNNLHIHSFTTCFVDVEPVGSSDELLGTLSLFAHCDSIFLTSDSGFVHSQIHYYVDFAVAAMAQGKRVVMVVGDTSVGALRYFEEMVPGIELLSLEG